VRISETYDRGWLRSFDGKTVGFDWGSGSFLIAFAMLTLDLQDVVSLAEKTQRTGRCTFAFLETGILADM
jgi:hypothetical protein